MKYPSTWTSAPSTSQLISSPGTIVRAGCRAASATASASPSVESWSVTARTRTPCFTARRTSSRGLKAPSEAVVCAWRSTRSPGPAPDISAASWTALSPGNAAVVSSLQIREVRQERPHAEPRPTFRAKREVLVAEGRPGDVEMHPRNVTHEFLHEDPRVDGAAAPRADVVDVGDVALQPLLVLVDHRELPHALADEVGGGLHAIRQRLIVRQQTRAEGAEGHDARAGERGQIDHLVGLDARHRVAEGVGERQTAFGVGVADLDRHP